MQAPDDTAAGPSQSVVAKPNDEYVSESESPAVNEDVSTASASDDCTETQVLDPPVCYVCHTPGPEYNSSNKFKGVPIVPVCSVECESVYLEAREVNLDAEPEPAEVKKETRKRTRRQAKKAKTGECSDEEDEEGDEEEQVDFSRCAACNRLNPQYMSTNLVKGVPSVPVCGVKCETKYLASKDKKPVAAAAASTPTKKVARRQSAAAAIEDEEGDEEEQVDFSRCAACNRLNPQYMSTNLVKGVPSVPVCGVKCETKYLASKDKKPVAAAAASTPTKKVARRQSAAAAIEDEEGDEEEQVDFSRCAACNRLNPQYMSTNLVKGVPSVPVCGVKCETKYLASKDKKPVAAAAASTPTKKVARRQSAAAAIEDEEGDEEEQVDFSRCAACNRLNPQYMSTNLVKGVPSVPVCGVKCETKYLASKGKAPLAVVLNLKKTQKHAVESGIADENDESAVVTEGDDEVEFVRCFMCSRVSPQYIPIDQVKKVPSVPVCSAVCEAKLLALKGKKAPAKSVTLSKQYDREATSAPVDDDPIAETDPSEPEHVVCYVCFMPDPEFDSSDRFPKKAPPVPVCSSVCEGVYLESRGLRKKVEKRKQDKIDGAEHSEDAMEEVKALDYKHCYMCSRANPAYVTTSELYASVPVCGAECETDYMKSKSNKKPRTEYSIESENENQVGIGPSHAL
uniref:Uncharacterized protein n=1 Tax=Globisporangium ultimum (strain ATCC 200006 / CBS 805.95 / DAOM BR144) TaxID=431595 RepID=K3WK75_GLOUD